MINLLESQHQMTLEKQDIIDLEEKVLRALDFSMHHVSAIPFLERFLRIFGID